MGPSRNGKLTAGITIKTALAFKASPWSPAPIVSPLPLSWCFY